MSAFWRKAENQLLKWKENYSSQYAAIIEGPRRVGKSTVAEEFAKKYYRSYIKIDFASVKKDVLAVFDDIAEPDVFFSGFRLPRESRCTKKNPSLFLTKSSDSPLPVRPLSILLLTTAIPALRQAPF